MPDPRLDRLVPPIAVVFSMKKCLGLMLEVIVEHIILSIPIYIYRCRRREFKMQDSLPMGSLPRRGRSLNVLPEAETSMPEYLPTLELAWSEVEPRQIKV
ncbi:hypothetical protein BDW68DRAFT_170964 [Aspergillus falconensis]